MVRCSFLTYSSARAGAGPETELGFFLDFLETPQHRLHLQPPFFGEELKTGPNHAQMRDFPHLRQVARQ